MASEGTFPLRAARYTFALASAKCFTVEHPVPQLHARKVRKHLLNKNSLSIGDNDNFPFQVVCEVEGVLRKRSTHNQLVDSALNVI